MEDSIGDQQVWVGATVLTRQEGQVQRRWQVTGHFCAAMILQTGSAVLSCLSLHQEMFHFANQQHL